MYVDDFASELEVPYQEGPETWLLLESLYNSAGTMYQNEIYIIDYHLKTFN